MVTLLKKEKALRHINSVVHEGKVVIFATDIDRKIWYTIKQDGFEDSYLNTPPENRTGWENWQLLEFPNESDDQSVVNKEKAELTYESDPSKFIVKSRYKTVTESAAAPVQVISALGHVYVFRQSQFNTLLVDRFVVDGMTNKLNRKLEVRFKRSREKYTPTKSMEKNAGVLANVDSLDFRDINGICFYEPTTEICTVNNLHEGWFSVVFLPTIENDVYRWHIFAYNSDNKKVELTTIRASSEGLFDVKDYTFFEPGSDSLSPHKIPGLLKRSLDISGVNVTNGLSATKYDLQQAQQTQSGEERLIRTATRLMLVIPTDKGTAAFSFGIAIDGTLAEIAHTPAKTEIRNRQQEVLLPLNTLDEVKAFADRTPPPKGIITGMSVGTDKENAEDLVKIATGNTAANLENRDLVKITGTTDYQGLYQGRYIDQNTFEIDLPSTSEMGYWEKQDPEAGGLIFDGMITAYARTADGKLRVTCENHGLENGDEVQIVGTDAYNNSYPVQKLDDTHFVIERKWALGEALNVKVMSRKRRGIALDGAGDYVEIPAFINPTESITVSLWAKSNTATWNDSGFFVSKRDAFRLHPNQGQKSISFYVFINGSWQVAEFNPSIDITQWHHYAGTFDGKKIALYIDGKESATTDATGKIEADKGVMTIGRDDGIESYFNGQIADVQLWKIARTAADIKDTMYLQMTGREPGLIGYWRLGGIAENQVIDFSVEGNHGKVYGDAFISAATLSRKLASGLDAVKYSNGEFFAVSERATYEESFEFKVNATPAIKLADLDNADGSNKIFTFSYWGKASRSADQEKTIAAPQIKQNKFEDLGSGWFRASASVTVPDGISLLRTFEIGNVKGVWQSLDIRKHRVRLISNSITEEKYTDEVTLVTLADNQVNLGASLSQIVQKEQLEAELICKKIDIEKRLAVHDSGNAKQQTQIDLKQQEISNQENSVNGLINEVNAWQKEWDVGQLQVVFYEHEHYGGAAVGYGIGVSDIHPWWNDRASSVKVPQGLRLTLFEHSGSGGSSAVLTGDCATFSGIDFNDATSSFKVETPLGFTDKSTIQRYLNNSNLILATARASLAQLQSELTSLKSITDQEVVALRSQLSAVNSQLSGVQTELNVFNTTFLNGVRTTQQTLQTMPPLNKDSKGLVTQGALLGFVQPITRINAIETCEGNVQLSYFDLQGRMRQTNYDGTVDSHNAASEQWLPDLLRACRNFNKSDSVAKLNNPLSLPNDWTIEAWFFYPLPKITPLAETQFNTLIRGQSADHHVIVKDNRQLGVYLNDDPLGKQFYDSGFNMEVLSRGWHHLTAVSRSDTMMFYIDGQLVGDTKSQAITVAQDNLNKAPNDANLKKKLEDLKKATLKSSSDIYAIGNYQGGTQPFGKLAEVRIWGVALTPQEININSNTLLSGYEPGLIAYYPMSEATGDALRDCSGHGNNGVVSNALPYGCAAPIGNPGDRVIKFDGIDDSITVADNANLQIKAYTVEVWIKPDGMPNEEYVGIIGKPGRNYYIWLNKAGFVHHRCHTAPNFNDGPPNTDNGSIIWNQWNHIAITNDGKTARTYINGKLKSEGANAGDLLDDPGTLYIARNLDGTTGSHFKGQIADVRIWKIARTEAHIRTNMYKRLDGKEAHLAAYYPLNEIKLDGTAQKAIDLVGNNNGTVSGAVAMFDNSLPISSDAVVSGEYTNIIFEPNSNRRMALMRRFLAYPNIDGAMLLPDKRVEAIELKWIGNGQFAPTLLGYIEGAPPVPSENLTVEEDYNGATSVELTSSEDMEFNWTRSQDSGLGASSETFLGVGGNMSLLTAPGGIGTSIETSSKFGFKANFDSSYQFQNESSVTSASSLTMTDKLELRGTLEESPKFPHLGNRFIPKNVGYALVVSALADVFITRLARTGKMISYEVRPVEGTPPDINTITFLMNPAYTMNGSLDGMTGTCATSSRFFKHVPEMRAQYGSLYPASYYRLKEAYDLKLQIEAEDKRRESYFSNFNVRSVDERSLNRNIDNGAAPSNVGVKREEDKASTQKTDEDKKKEQDAIAQQFTIDVAAGADEAGAATKAKQAEIQSKIGDQDQRIHATNSFAGWQKRMEDLQIKAGKRNIINTYVWDSDGGLRSESQSFANTIENTIGGSFSMNGAFGSEKEFDTAATIELTLQATVNLTQTMSKTETRRNGFELKIDLSGVESKGITDYNDLPFMPGEKVNRYRFMSFYLEGSTNNFQDFFNYVVDPEWLASNAESARALRQTQAGKPNNAWRVFHRVTYVERPALMGFGRDMRQVRLAADPFEAQAVLDKISALEKSNEDLAKKLDLILEKLNPQD